MKQYVKVINATIQILKWQKLQVLFATVRAWIYFEIQYSMYINGITWRNDISSRITEIEKPRKCHVSLKSGYFASNKLAKHVHSQGHAIQEL